MTQARALLLAAAVATAPPSVAAPVSSPDTTGLAQAFVDPPASARPFVWWHWMNGNISKDGIRKDLEWMKRVGIGGLQNFDANLATPQIVPDRLVYMTPPWKDAFRFAVEEADRLGLEFAIASSPGWSETGGPWVKPEDGLKKLVWSETQIDGGRRFRGMLASPPAVTGPFQNLPKTADMMMGAPSKPVADHYADVAVFAYPMAPETMPGFRAFSGSGDSLDGSALVDGDPKTTVTAAAGTPNGPPALTIRLDRPQIVRSASLFVPGGKPPFGSSLFKAELLAKEGDSWRHVTDIETDTLPVTVSFPAVTAREFRLIFNPTSAPAILSGDPAPGAIGIGAFAASAPKTVKIAQFALSAAPRIDHFETKAGFTIAQDYYALPDVAPSEAGVAPAAVVDLTSRMSPDGSLDWTPPKGAWRVVRIGYSLLGTTNHPATAEATGLEVDKFDGPAVRAYMEHYLDLYRETVGPDLMGSHGIRALLTDSIEVGAANWTPRLVEQFRARRGYDPTPWLPTLTGVLVGTRAQSDAFLYDFRRTLADLISSEHYSTVADVAHRRGLKVYGEALEDNRPSLGDDMTMRSHADVPMAAMWTFPRATGPKPTYLADDKGASSVAHLYGRNVVAAESLTSLFAPWGYGPGDLRRFVDLEFALGINRPIVHTSVHQPSDAKVPGLSLFVVGQFFNRHESWAEFARPWVDYMARSSLLLQQGRNVADVAYFYGEEAPLTGLYGQTSVKDAPTRYAYDFVSADALNGLLSVQNGDIVSTGGARFRALYLGGSSDRMTLFTLRKIASLVQAGATVVGRAPRGSPSLNDDAATFRALVARLWPGGTEARFGAGRVIATPDIEAALRQVGCEPDFSYTKPQSGGALMFVHRWTGDADIYFVSDRSGRAERIEASFRVTGRAPEVWRADKGTVEPVSFRVEGGRTIVPLDFDADGSLFVMFRRPTGETSRSVAAPAWRPVATLDHPWKVSFQQGRGAPASLELAQLGSLSEQADAGVRYFSGVATYVSSFDLPRGVRPGAPLMLDLGKVGDVAEVRVNGRSVGYAWHAPYRLDVGAAVKAGRNQLEVRVADLWVNRLIGDAQPGAAKVAYVTIPTYRKDAPLRPSGLIGPVVISAERR